MLSDLIDEFRRQQKTCEAVLAELDDPAFFERPGLQVNSVALIVKHLAGNLRSRWTDFLTTDGEKPDRNRDGEFELRDGDSREALMRAWGQGWEALWGTLDRLTDDDLTLNVTIRGEVHTVQQAIIRSLAHTAYHAGQIAYLKRLLRPESKWLTIPPGESQAYASHYRAQK